MHRVTCADCGVKNEKLAFLSANTKYTLRFAMQIGGLCRAMTITDVARRMHLDWHTVKELDKLYMREQLARAGPPTPNVIGVDEISIEKRHVYRIVVSDLERKRSIWYGGDGRGERDMDMFYAFLGKESVGKIRLAVMDMWKPFRQSTSATLRKRPFCSTSSTSFAISVKPSIKSARPNMAASRDRNEVHQGTKICLAVAQREPDERRQKRPSTLLKANKRLNTAYILRESFDQLWDYRSEAWARRFFENWKAQLRWQRLKPYEMFAEMIERHWDGIAAYCRPENKVALGFVEGFNNKIRVLQRRAYGLRDEEYLKLKILTASLPEL